VVEELDFAVERPVPGKVGVHPSSLLSNCPCCSAKRGRAARPARAMQRLNQRAASLGRSSAIARILP
jgi:hypothetical protein